MKILFTGDRNWKDIITVKRELRALPDGSILIHGACRGLDLMVDAVAKTTFKSKQFDIRPYPAKWKEFGRAAGPIRNQEMLHKEHTIEEPIDLCLAFHNDLPNSKGTKDMMDRAEKSKILTRLITSNS